MTNKIAGSLLLISIAGVLSAQPQISPFGCLASPTAGTGWTSATANNSTQSLATRTAAPFVQVELVQTSTVTGGAVTFQGDPGDGAFISVPVAQVLAQNTNAQLTNPYTLIASTNQIFMVSMSGFVSLQLKLTSVITGTATITPQTTQICYTPPPTLDSAGNLLTKVNVALPAGTNVIGHVIADTTSTTAVTQPTGTNLHAVLDTTSTTAVTQATGTNLHAVLDTTSTTAVTQATAANLNAAVVGVGTAGTASGGVLTVQGAAAMTKLLVTPDSVALPANQSVNVAQINAVTPLMGNGVTGTGSPRVTIASDNTAFAVNSTLTAETTKVIGTARMQGNVGGVLDAATGAAPPANAILHAGLGSGATGGFLLAMPICDTFANINIVTATTTLLVTGVSGRHVRICHIDMVAAGADNVGIISGTGATCGTGSAAIVGTTSATGYNFAANGGITSGSGLGTIMRTVATGDSVCLITSAAVQLSGVISYSIY